MAPFDGSAPPLNLPLPAARRLDDQGVAVVVAAARAVWKNSDRTYSPPADAPPAAQLLAGFISTNLSPRQARRLEQWARALQRAGEPVVLTLGASIEDFATVILSQQEWALMDATVAEEDLQRILACGTSREAACAYADELRGEAERLRKIAGLEDDPTDPEVAAAADPESQEAKRAADPLFWRRAVFRRVRIVQTQLDDMLGLVGRGAPRISADALDTFRQARQRAQDYQKGKMVIVMQAGEPVSLSLDEIARSKEASEIARAYAVNIGLDQVRKTLGFTALFITQTLPGEYHVRPTKPRRRQRHNAQNANGEAPHRWNGHLTARARHDRLQHDWSEFLRKARRYGARLFGYQVREAHRDGTPHRHAMVYTDNVNAIWKAAAEMEPQHAPNPDLGVYAPRKGRGLDVMCRAGAFEDCRINIQAWTEQIDAPAKQRRRCGSASPATYMLKYVLKTVGEIKQGSTSRDRAWAARDGIRRFDAFGLEKGAVGTFGTLYRLSPEEAWRHEGTLLGEAATLIQSRQYGTGLVLLRAFTDLNRSPIDGSQRADTGVLVPRHDRRVGRYGTAYKVIVGVDQGGMALIDRVYTCPKFKARQVRRWTAPLPPQFTDAANRILRTREDGVRTRRRGVVLDSTIAAALDSEDQGVAAVARRIVAHAMEARETDATRPETTGTLSHPADAYAARLERINLWRQIADGVTHHVREHLAITIKSDGALTVVRDALNRASRAGEDTTHWRRAIMEMEQTISDSVHAEAVRQTLERIGYIYRAERPGRATVEFHERGRSPDRLRVA